MRFTLLIFAVLLLSLSAQRHNGKKHHSADNSNEGNNSGWARDGNHSNSSTVNSGHNSGDGEGYGNAGGHSTTSNPTTVNSESDSDDGEDDGEDYGNDGGSTTSTPSNPTTVTSGSNSGDDEGSGNAGDTSTTNPPTTTTSTPSNSSVSSSSDFITQCLQYQNEFRTPLGIASLTWSADLASGAASWAASMASSGSLTHSHGAYGENIAYRSPSSNQIELLMAQFTDEKQYFIPGCTYPDCTTGGVVGHYTQVVWAKTTQVGCGIATEGSRVYLCCRYLAAGNVSGEKVY